MLCLVITLGVIVSPVFSCRLQGRVVGGSGEGEGLRALIVLEEKNPEKEQKIYITLDNKPLVCHSVWALLTWPEVEVLVSRGWLGKKEKVLRPRDFSLDLVG